MALSKKKAWGLLFLEMRCTISEIIYSKWGKGL